MPKMIYLDESQVRDMIKDAEDKGLSISVRCIRKGKSNPHLGVKQGELHTLICGRKPTYQGTSKVSREDEDARNSVLTVWATNRMTGTNHGAWRRVNLDTVQEVRYKEVEYKVQRSRV